MDFGWDEGKRNWLIDDLQIDFHDMKALFDGRPRLSYPSPRTGEDRFVSVGEVKGRLFAVVWMWRGNAIWMITARRAWKREERHYLEAIERH
ncbi:BrnT family toxin [Jiella sonneratiae]|uniref:BrnT family toxin n=1 Tax=Jiella sonneratiae TaxID=2816856 RepID=A0ABS3J4D4_9HYPH|nr:BrnT family toxin [Jiella sonneratiae]MBO0904549.1 BrnT family toxin [Jiella sonneratiae]